MWYAKSKKYDINEFCDLCGFFFGGTDVNNGYGCLHPEQPEVDYDTFGEVGKCYGFSCPLAYNPSNDINTVQPIKSQAKPPVYWSKRLDNRSSDEISEAEFTNLKTTIKEVL